MKLPQTPGTQQASNPVLLRLSLLPTAALLLVPSLAQDLGDLSAPARTHPRDLVTYVPEPQQIPAGRDATLAIHLRVAEGFHINSHTPRSDLLLPTVLTLNPIQNPDQNPAQNLAENPHQSPPEQGTTAGQPIYPPGTPYRFTGSTDTLDVYTGVLALRLPVKANPGSHVLHAILRYQACDNASCYPPRKLSIDIPFTARP